MPVYKLVEEMPYDEFLMWVSYFESRPIEWRSDLRAAYLMNTFGEKRKPQDIFPSLAVISKGSKKNPLANSQMLRKMLMATGGDKLEILKDIK
jgi:hypothetical protein